MTLEEFSVSLKNSEPPPSFAPLVEAMWWEAKGDWDRAHSIAQDLDSKEAAWVHAYLHRKEGDAFNAGYWYRRAERPHSNAQFELEWKEIIRQLLAMET